MRRIAAAAVASLIALAGPALSDDTAPGQRAGSTATMSPDPDPTASTTASGFTVDLALAAIAANPTTAEQIPTIAKVGKVKVIHLAELSAHDGERPRLDKAIADGKAGIDGLQAAVGASRPLSEELGRQKVELKSVVATRFEADGSVTVFVR